MIYDSLIIPQPATPFFTVGELPPAQPAESSSRIDGMTLVLGGIIVSALVVALVGGAATMALLRGVKSNPVVGTRKFKEYELQAFEASYKNEWDVEALLPNGLTVGRATFAGVRDYEVEDEDGFPKLVALKGWQVDVAPAHRRRGLAAAMYRFAEEAFRLPVRPGDFQTPEGAMFLQGRSS